VWPTVASASGIYLGTYVRYRYGLMEETLIAHLQYHRCAVGLLTKASMNRARYPPSIHTTSLLSRSSSTDSKLASSAAGTTCTTARELWRTAASEDPFLQWLRPLILSGCTPWRARRAVRLASDGPKMNVAGQEPLSPPSSRLSVAYAARATRRWPGGVPRACWTSIRWARRVSYTVVVRKDFFDWLAFST